MTGRAGQEDAFMRNMAEGASGLPERGHPADASALAPSHGERDLAPISSAFTSRQLTRLHRRYAEQEREYHALSLRYQEIHEAHRRLSAQFPALQADQTTLRAIRASRGWKLLARYYRFKDAIKHGLFWSRSASVSESQTELEAPPPAPLPASAPQHFERVGGPRVPSPRKFRVVVVYQAGQHESCNRYRVFNIREALTLTGIEARHVADESIPERLAEILSHDLIVLARCCRKATIDLLLEAAHFASVPVVFDIDDCLFEESIIPHSDFLREKRPEDALAFVHGYRDVLDRCAYFTGTTDYLVERASVLDKRAFRIRNGLSSVQQWLSQNASDGRAAVESDGCVRLGYFSGSMTHQGDFRLITPVLRDLLNEFPQTRLLIAGYLDLAEFPELAPFAERIENRPFVDWRELPTEIARADINLIPLVANPFNESKSDLKYYEAAIVGVPSVASPMRILANAIRDGVNGFLADSPIAWYEPLRRLIVDPILRRTIGARAREHAEREYLPIVVGREASAAYRRIIEAHRRTLGASERAWAIVILLGELNRIIADRSPMISLGRALTALGAHVTFVVSPGDPARTAVDVERAIAAHFIEPMCAIQIGHEIPCADFLIATDAATAARAHAYRHRAWRTVYVASDVGEQNDRCFDFGLPLLPVGHFLGEMLQHLCDGVAATLPRWAEPSPERARVLPNARQLLVAASRDLPSEALHYASELLDKLHQRCPDLKIMFAGELSPHMLPEHPRLGSVGGPGWHEALDGAPLGLALYSGMPPGWLCDMLAAGCPTVAAGLKPQFLQPSDELWPAVADIRDAGRALESLIMDPVLATEQSHRGRDFARRLASPDEAASILLRVLAADSFPAQMPLHLADAA